MNCPITCSCRRGGEGVFLCAAALWFAEWSQLFVGYNFNSTATGTPPDAMLNAPLIFGLWVVALSVGTTLAGYGLNALLRHGDGPPLHSSWLMATAAFVALDWQLYPHSWGDAWMRGVEGLYVALLAGSVANVCLAACARVWFAGFVVGEAESVPDRGQFLALIGQQDATIMRLVAERDQLAQDLESRAATNDLDALVELLGGRRQVLASVHPDRCTKENDKKAATVRFQKVQAMLEGRGRS